MREQEKNDTLLGRAYHKAIDDKRRARYEKFTDAPIDEHLIVFESFMGRKYADSPKAIYEYMLKNPTYNEYRFVWCFGDAFLEKCSGESADELQAAIFKKIKNDARTEIVRWGSEDYYKAYARAGYWFANTRIPKALEKRPGQKYIQCWHGTPLKRLGCDIITDDEAEREATREVMHNDVSRYDCLISPSAFFTEVMSSAMDLAALGKQDVPLECGYPRNDYIVNHNEDDLARIKQNLGIPEGKKVVLYAPTYRENQRESNGKYFYKEPIDFEQLKSALGDEYIILFRAHYYIAEQLDLEKYAGFVINATDYPEINELYVVSDILVTDYSSVFFDFGILKRPILFYMYDLEFYRDELRGFYLSTDELPGPIVEAQTELEQKLLHVDEWFNTTEMKAKYEAFSKKFTYLEDGRAAERVVTLTFINKCKDNLT